MLFTVLNEVIIPRGAKKNNCTPSYPSVRKASQWCLGLPQSKYWLMVGFIVMILLDNCYKCSSKHFDGLVPARLCLNAWFVLQQRPALKPCMIFFVRICKNGKGFLVWLQHHIESRKTVRNISERGTQHLDSRCDVSVHSFNGYLLQTPLKTVQVFHLVTISVTVKALQII